MKTADELATSHLLGAVGEFWMVWDGLRSELQAEVRFDLRMKGITHCSRDELREFLSDVEVKYPRLRDEELPPLPVCSPGCRSACARCPSRYPSLLDMRLGGTPCERVFAAEVFGLRSVWEQSPFADPLSAERSGSGQGARKASATR